MPRQLVLRIDRMPYTPNTHSFWISVFFFFISRKLFRLCCLVCVRIPPGFAIPACYPKAKKEDKEEDENKGDVRS